MRFVVVDLEATCWENDGEFQRANSEVIEIGAVSFTEDNPQERTLQLYIKPTKHPVLTDYCTNLTGITQETVDNAWPAPVVYKDFIQWVTPDFLGSTMASWGEYDWKMLRKEMELHGLRFPFNTHINIKQAFAEYDNSRPRGLRRAIESMGWTFMGQHHSGVDDARNAARILKHLIKEAPHVIRPARILR